MKTLNAILLLLLVLPASRHATAQEPMTDAELKQKMIVEGPVPLNPKKTVLLDQKNNSLILECVTCLEQGVLEMFLCPKQTKEHESIVSLDAKMAVVHAGLLALGAKPGTPVSYHPEYKPPTGQKIDIFLKWTDEDGKLHRYKAQQLIRNVTFRYFEEPLATVPQGVVIDDGENSLRYDKMNQLLLWFGHMTKERKKELLAMSEDTEYQKAINKMFDDSQFVELKADFVFVGSKFSKLEDGTNLYQAEMGSGICVANFPDSMIDINIESSASDANRLYEPYTERLPPSGTKVQVELFPVREELSIRQIIDSPINNLFRIDETLYSGEGPEAADEFAALKELGVRTLVSVDGAEPNVELANQHGLRYVHIPVNYNGLSKGELAGLSQVMQKYETPVFVHCHHGKHRGPTAAAICGMASGKLNQQQALDLMEIAGTDKKYAGLWETIHQFDPKEIHQAVALKESVTPENLVAAMLRIDHAFEQLAKSPNELKEDERTKLVTLLVEEFKESARLRASDDTLRASLLEASKQAESLDVTRAENITAIGQSCNTCHAAYRDKY